MKVKIKGVKKVTMKLATGALVTYYYHRGSGRRLEGQPGTNQFIESFAAAERALRDRGEGTFADLVRRFEKSPYFEDLGDATREAYKWKFRAIEKRWGTCPSSTFNDESARDEFRKDALAWRDELGLKSRRSADNLLSAVARVLSFALEVGEIRGNPLATFKRIYKSDRSDKIWSDALIKAFIEVARPQMKTAMMIASNMGLRASDLRKLAWSAYDGETIALRTGKKGTTINVPVTRELKRYLDGLPKTGVLVLTTTTGKAYAKRYFNEQWREDSDAAGAGDLNYHDVRGTAATHLAEAGASASVIGSVMGWKTETAQRIIDTYVARSSTLAAVGIELLEKHRKRKARNVKPERQSNK